MQNSVVQQLPDAAGLPVVGLSAASGLGLGRLLPVVERLHNAWNQRIPTSKLNAWSAKVALLHRKLQTSSAMHVCCQHGHEPQGLHSGQQSMWTLHAAS